MSGIVGSYFNTRGSGVVAKLGTDGQVFTSTGAGLSQGFEAVAAGGAWTFLQEVTASDDATILVGNSTLFSTTYEVYKIFYNRLVPITDSVDGNIRLSVGGSVQTGSYKYAYKRMYGGGGSPTNVVSTSATQLDQFLGNSMSGDADHGSWGEVTLIDPASTAFHKQILSQAVAFDASANAFWSYGSGLYLSTSIIDGVQFFFDSGNVDTGTFRLYGLATS